MHTELSELEHCTGKCCNERAMCLSFCVLRFLSMLEEEVYSPNSPIWSEDFMIGSSGGQIPRGSLNLTLYPLAV